jgi:hypothetical protein
MKLGCCGPCGARIPLVVVFSSKIDEVERQHMTLGRVDTKIIPISLAVSSVLIDLALHMTAVVIGSG